MSDLSQADEDELVRIRAQLDDDRGKFCTDHEMRFVLRLLDAAQARLLQAERERDGARADVTAARAERDNAEKIAAAAEERASALASRPGSKVLDHKWLDPKCIEEGCQSLVLKSIYESAVNGRQDFRAAFKAERERASVLAAAIDQVEASAQLNDESDLGERAADAFNAGNAHRGMNERLLDYTAVLVKHMRAALSSTTPKCSSAGESGETR